MALFAYSDPDNLLHPDPASRNADAQDAIARWIAARIDRGRSKASADDEGPIHNATPGETQMLQRLLAAEGGVKTLALHRLAEQTAIKSLGWSASRDDVPRGRPAVAVQFQDQTLGWLHAPAPTSLAELQPHADWLACWLAVEARIGHYRELALRDELTGAWNRRFFDHFLPLVLERAESDGFQVTLMIYDIDDFKAYNDRFGHPAGDKILRETARLMQSVVREHDVVARIGGDEFAVVFWDAAARPEPHGQHPADVLHAARRFRQAVQEQRFPDLVEGTPATLTISGGLAGFPKDGRSPAQLMAVADQMLLESKRQGKNVLTLGPGARP